MKKRLIAIGLSAVLVILGFPTQNTAGEERKISVSPSELPAAIRDAVRKALPNSEIVNIEKEVEGKDVGQYDFEVRSEGKEYEVEVSPEGKVIEVKEIGAGKGTQGKKKWTTSFGQENCTFLSTGKNPFFILEPGYQLVLESEREKVAITVLNETRMIGGVETRVVEEREEENGKLKEISMNFFVICKEHGDVFYFGEEVDIYENDRIVRHSGEWRADEPDSRAGIMMPGTIFLGARYYQEISPNAMDRAEIMSNNEKMQTPAGTFKNCLLTEETSALESDEECYKTYAPGIGLIQDEDLLLTRHGYINK